MFDDENDGWDDAQQTRDETSGGTWLRLKQDKEKALIVLPAPPFAYKQVWLEAEGRSEIYDANKHDGIRPQGRFAFPVFQPITGSKEYEGKIFDASGEAFDTIKTVRDKFGSRYLYELTRNGTGTKTKYSLLPERELKPAEIEYLKTLELPDAEKLTLGGSTQNDTPDAPEGDDPWADGDE